MIKECLVLGKVNVGKTLFVLNFAEFLGLKELDITFEYPSGKIKNKKYSLTHARGLLTDSAPHKTRSLQKIALKLPAGKGKKELILADSSGVIDGIHEDNEIRKGIAQTLLAITNASVILHIIDASVVGKISSIEKFGEIDTQIAEYADLKGGYVILANKIDIPTAEEGICILKEKFPDKKIIPISAKNKKGFKEVKTFVSRNI